MKRVALVLVALAVGAAPARAESDPSLYRAAPTADLAVPFSCDWGYDWEERCYRDASDRLPIGGDVDKIWRSALRFPLDALAPGSIVVSATLFLSFDGVCLGPTMTERPCPARSYTLDVHPIFGRDWFREREVEFGPLVTRGSFWAGTPQRLSFDVTDLVIEWVEFGVPNDGFLLKLADEQEERSGGGPKLPSAEFANAQLRPTLEVTYVRP